MELVKCAYTKRTAESFQKNLVSVVQQELHDIVKFGAM
jgi:hypothetical protein